MKLVQGQPEIEWWRAHPEHGLDWNAYRKLEQNMIKKGDLHALSDRHGAMDEEELMRAYDARAMQDLEDRVRIDRAKASPLRAAEPRGDSPRRILEDPQFSGRKSPWNWKGPAGTIGLGLILGLFEKQSQMAEMGMGDDFNPKYAEPGVTWSRDRGISNPYAAVRK